MLLLSAQRLAWLPTLGYTHVFWGVPTPLPTSLRANVWEGQTWGLGEGDAGESKSILILPQGLDTVLSRKCLQTYTHTLLHVIHGGLQTWSQTKVPDSQASADSLPRQVRKPGLSAEADLELLLPCPFSFASMSPISSPLGGDSRPLSCLRPWWPTGRRGELTLYRVISWVSTQTKTGMWHLGLFKNFIFFILFKPLGRGASHSSVDIGRCWPPPQESRKKTECGAVLPLSTAFLHLHNA